MQYGPPEKAVEYTYQYGTGEWSHCRVMVRVAARPFAEVGRCKLDPDFQSAWFQKFNL